MVTDKSEDDDYKPVLVENRESQTKMILPEDLSKYNLYDHKYIRAKQKINWVDFHYENIKQNVPNIAPSTPTKKHVKWNSIKYFDNNDLCSAERSKAQRTQLSAIKTKLNQNTVPNILKQIPERKDYLNLLNAKKYKNKIKSLKTQRCKDIANYNVAINNENSLILEISDEPNIRSVTERSYIKPPYRRERPNLSLTKACNKSKFSEKDNELKEGKSVLKKGSSRYMSDLQSSKNKIVQPNNYMTPLSKLMKKHAEILDQINKEVSSRAIGQLIQNT